MNDTAQNFNGNLCLCDIWGKFWLRLRLGVWSGFTVSGRRLRPRHHASWSIQLCVAFTASTLLGLSDFIRPSTKPLMGLGNLAIAPYKDILPNIPTISNRTTCNVGSFSFSSSWIKLFHVSMLTDWISWKTVLLLRIESVSLQRPLNKMTFNVVRLWAC